MGSERCIRDSDKGEIGVMRVRLGEWERRDVEEKGIMK